ncbi:Endonuclease/exonuclease/phosphatase [Cladochytrium replicatum]|nr:Endonuclease/exonuclease/phosphatase [Cladochytrium replicatum]
MTDKDLDTLNPYYHMAAQPYFAYNNPGSPGLTNGSPVPASPSMSAYNAAQHSHQVYSASGSRYGAQTLHFANKLGAGVLPSTVGHPLNHSIAPGMMSTSYQLSMNAIPVTSGVANGIPIATVTSQPVTAAGPHHQKQLEQQQLSRQSSMPHHHASVAATLTRRAGLTAGSHPNGNVHGTPVSSVTVNGVTINPSDRPSQWTVLDLGGMKMKNVSKELFQYSFLTTVYLSYNLLSYVPIEMSRLRNLVVLDLSANRISSIPPEMGLLTNLREFLLFDNQLTVLPGELGFLYQLETFGLEGNPLSEPFLSIIQKDGTAAVISYLRENCPVSPSPPEREWITLEEEAPPGTHTADTFTILCYNMLSEKYATAQAYAYTPSWALAWDYRKDLLLQEILTYSPDICCLQEVETSQFEEYFEDQLRQQGDYDSVFFPKSRALTMNDAERRSVDGCAIFFKSSKFALIEKHLIEFQRIAMQRPEFRGKEEILNRVMVKDNIAVIALLESKETGARLMVANAHLHWDPVYNDVKVVQTTMLLDEVQRLVQQAAASSKGPANSHLASNPLRLPLIVCGDFNSLPNSGVYEYLSNGFIPLDHQDFMGITYNSFLTSEGGADSSSPNETVTSTSEDPPSAESSGNRVDGTSSTEANVGPGISHKMSLKSAYAHINELNFTNFTPTFKGTIDYVWFNTIAMNVTGLLGAVDSDYLSKVVGFPNWHHPSDHIPLVVQLRLKPSVPPGHANGGARPVRFK